MKKTIIIFIFTTLSLSASCLRIAYQSGIKCTGNQIIVDDLSETFIQDMKVSDNEVTVLDIPIYVYSDSKKKISLTLEEKKMLSNSNEVIDTKFYYSVRNIDREITLNKKFTLLQEKKSKRNGNTILAKIRIKVNHLSDTQTAGRYTLKKTLKASLGKETSASALWNLKGNVSQVNLVGFEDVSQYTSSQRFKATSINYGLFKLNTINTQTRMLYVKSNTMSACKISFKTSPLISQIDENYQINMHYYYKKNGEKEQEITNEKPFTLIRGKSPGTKIGEMRFETEKLSSELIAGEYKAVIHVTVSAN